MIRSTRSRLVQPLLWAMLVGLAAAAPHAWAYPEPDILSQAWELDLQWKQPRIIEVELDSRTDGVKYFYLPYTVTNRTGEDRQFIPEFTMLANTGNLLTAGRKVHPAVYQAIKAEQRNKFLETPAEIIGRLLQGEDYARDSVAIWRLPAETDIDEVRIFITGLSGETAVVQPPDSDEQVILRKTRVIDFDIPGGVAASPKQAIKQTDADWVMR